MVQFAAEPVTTTAVTAGRSPAGQSFWVSSLKQIVCNATSGVAVLVDLRRNSERGLLVRCKLMFERHTAQNAYTQTLSLLVERPTGMKASSQ